MVIELDINEFEKVKGLFKNKYQNQIKMQISVWMEWLFMIFRILYLTWLIYICILVYV